MKILIALVAFLLAVDRARALPARRARKSSNPSRAPVPTSTAVLPATLNNKRGAAMSPHASLSPRLLHSGSHKSAPRYDDASLREAYPVAPASSAVRSSSLHENHTMPDRLGSSAATAHMHGASARELDLAQSKTDVGRDEGKKPESSTATPSSAFPSEDMHTSRAGFFSNEEANVAPAPGRRVTASKGVSTSFGSHPRRVSLSTARQQPSELSANMRRKLFEEHWNQLDIDWKNPPDPQHLVDLVKGIRIPGIPPLAIGQMAAHRIRAQTPESYMAEYRFKSDHANSKIGRQTYLSRKRERGGDVETSDPSKKRKVAKFALAVEGGDGADGTTPKMHSRTARALKRYSEIVGALDGKNVWSLPPDRLEKTTRNFPIGNHSQGYINQIISSHLHNIGRAEDARLVSRFRDLNRRKEKYEGMSKEQKRAQWARANRKGKGSKGGKGVS